MEAFRCKGIMGRPLQLHDDADCTGEPKIHKARSQNLRPAQERAGLALAREGRPWLQGFDAGGYFVQSSFRDDAQRRAIHPGNEVLHGFLVEDPVGSLSDEADVWCRQNVVEGAKRMSIWQRLGIKDIERRACDSASGQCVDERCFIN